MSLNLIMNIANKREDFMQASQKQANWNDLGGGERFKSASPSSYWSDFRLLDGRSPTTENKVKAWRENVTLDLQVFTCPQLLLLWCYAGDAQKVLPSRHRSPSCHRFLLLPMFGV
jgi:hypothetical protein